eukprot:scaffold1528_cov198-Pinguiococcus_pyrenoidosus.AAC.15
MYCSSVRKAENIIKIKTSSIPQLQKLPYVVFLKRLGGEKTQTPSALLHPAVHAFTFMIDLAELRDRSYDRSYDRSSMIDLAELRDRSYDRSSDRSRQIDHPCMIDHHDRSGSELMHRRCLHGCPVSSPPMMPSSAPLSTICLAGWTLSKLWKRGRSWSRNSWVELAASCRYYESDGLGRATLAGLLGLDDRVAELLQGRVGVRGGVGAAGSLLQLHREGRRGALLGGLGVRRIHGGARDAQRCSLGERVRERVDVAVPRGPRACLSQNSDFPLFSCCHTSAAHRGGGCRPPPAQALPRGGARWQSRSRSCRASRPS